VKRLLVWLAVVAISILTWMLLAATVWLLY